MTMLRMRCRECLRIFTIEKGYNYCPICGELLDLEKREEKEDNSK